MTDVAGAIPGLPAMPESESMSNELDLPVERWSEMLSADMAAGGLANNSAQDHSCKKDCLEIGIGKQKSEANSKVQVLLQDIEQAEQLESELLLDALLSVQLVPVVLAVSISNISALACRSCSGCSGHGCAMSILTSSIIIIGA